VNNVRKAETLADKALKELEDKNYTSEYKYVEKFGVEDYVYTLNNEAELTKEIDALYTEFSNWLGSWEM
jgi:predicted transcriptional regulator